jgi:hypothetical protein
MGFGLIKSSIKNGVLQLNELLLKVRQSLSKLKAYF